LLFNTQEGRFVFKVADVSREFIFKNEKNNRSNEAAQSNNTESECIKQITQLMRLIQTQGNIKGKATAEIKESARKCLNIAHVTLAKAVQAKQKPSNALWTAISELADAVVESNLIDKDMPWFWQTLNEHQQESKRYLNQYISSSYCDSGSALWKSGKFQEARQKYKRGVRFEPEPVMAVQTHYNWALSINAANNYFEKYDAVKFYEFLAEFLEMIAHFDEVVQQYAMITDNGFKKSLKALDDRAKEMIQQALAIKESHLDYSTAHPSQLIFKKDGQEVPLHVTWTKYDFASGD